MTFNQVVEKTAQVVLSGGVILYPTDTIWGIGGDATNEEVIKKIYDIKNRPDSKSLVSLVSGMVMLEKLTTVSPQVTSILAESKKPTTIIYQNVNGIHSSAIADDGSAAIRIPHHEFCSELIKHINRPLISTSANISGEPSPASFTGVSEEIKTQVDFIIPLHQDENEPKAASTILKVEDEKVIVIRE